MFECYAAGNHAVDTILVVNDAFDLSVGSAWTLHDSDGIDPAPDVPQSGVTV